MSENERKEEAVGSEERKELTDNAIDKAHQLMEKWKNRLTLDNLRLAERYLVGELEILVDLRIGLPGYARLCAVLKNREFGDSGGG